MNDPKENPEMIGYAEAQREILARVMPRPAVQLPIMAARNSVLAEDVSCAVSFAAIRSQRRGRLCYPR
jgi:molybdopterin biosynthesis enzyme